MEHGSATLTQIDLENNGITKALDQIQLQLQENHQIKQNLKMPEILREVKVLRYKYKILKNTQEEIWNDMALTTQLEKEFI